MKVLGDREQTLCHKKDVSKYGISAALAMLLIIQLVLFTAGYRLTADDAMFLQYAWRGLDHVWEAAREFAYLTGRIGHFFMTPLNALGAYWAGNWLTRLLMVLGYFGVMVLIACYASRLLAAGAWRVTAFMLLGMLALHPLAYEHMPPNAYPLQNTVPFLLVLAVRLWLVTQSQAPTPLVAILYVIQGIAMLVSEYVILLATALIAIEHLNHAATSSGNQRKFLGISVCGPKLLADTLLVALVMAIYLLFLWGYPSQYEGNSIDGLPNLERFFLTSVYHVLSGLSFYHLSLPEMTLATWGMTLLVSLTTFAAAWYLLLRMPLPSRKQAIITLLVTAFFMLYMAFPLAATSRQQQWCLEFNSCGYLDSRTSFLGVGVLLYCCAGLLLIKRPRRKVAPVLAALLALTAGLNHASNQRTANSMAQRSQPWEAASQLACELPSAAVIRAGFINTIDPQQLVALHDYAQPQLYWLEYMNHLRSSGHCGDALATEQDAIRNPFYLPLADPGFVKVGNMRSVGYEVLGSGWSSIESWGVWSDGESSSLILDLSDPELANVSALVLHFSVYFGPSIAEQEVAVWVEGELQRRWFFPEEDSANCCLRHIDVREHIGKEEVKVRLDYQFLRDPSYPGEGGDTRQLALGLRLLELVE